jgi:hypothetical protein
LIPHGEFRAARKLRGPGAPGEGARPYALTLFSSEIEEISWDRRSQPADFGFSSHRPSRPPANPNLRLSWPRRTVQDKEANSLCQCQGDQITRAHRAHSPHPPLPAHPTGHPDRGLLEASLQPFVAPWLGPDGRSRLRVTPTSSQILPFFPVLVCFVSFVLSCGIPHKLPSSSLPEIADSSRRR